ncbi:Archaeal PaREP1/PaREP8 family [Pyrobaculum oguniense TE7]|uniref:Archaeal PaREP1/PaREP8 family n=1 Tax=Pyrobaculum oguniense (strain DSM 13380 / JCM 10595 / TE7) TaxID=698757 RepID=H6QDV7_PYROT|nr:Archaeal PaREP1/PaREP8 family [Pyrobaculum oguniense TE7]
MALRHQAEGETGDAELARLWHAADSLHTNFYEAWATPELVKDAVKDVKPSSRS